MMTPAKGDYPSIPLNAEGRKVADAWDPAKDEAAGNQCKAYGAGAIMRVAGRFRITWENDNTLRVDSDEGNQSRVFRFGRTPPSNGGATWQGDSTAQWEYAGGRRGEGNRGGSLKVVTTHLKPGYLQKNGVPYGANAVVTEHFDLVKEPNGDTWLIVTTLVNDPQYLTRPFQRSTHLKKQADSSGWAPMPCSAR
jgi:hypothetical protein